ncbi:hypothetical protein EJ08DRAFT_443726 [Tothia fuscella]|uniref:Sister chromatid cohesion protein n=1 Tax=Tothia fuscella TaxID=1048955 RepID=A0A9P4NJ56_9PEZI|nr:hypothetical protein EJ08DRAFT_443726 [Tothia fuscella]
MDKADVAYRYPTPETPPPVPKQAPRSPIPKREQINGSVHEAIALKSPKVVVKRSQTPTRTPTKVPVVSVDNHTRHATATQQTSAALEDFNAPKSSNPAILIPALQKPIQRADYQEFPEIDRDVSNGRKRKRDAEPRINIIVDQQQKADAALQNLQSTIYEVFEAEDNLQPDTSGAAYADTTLHFLQSAYNDADTHVLTRTTQNRLENAIQKAVSASSFGEIPVDDLLRVQKICESTISSIEALSLEISGDAGEGDIAEWLQQLELAENGLQAGRVLLRTMTAGREEKQLYSEDTLNIALESLEKVIEKVVRPVVEARKSSPGSSGVFEIYSKEKKALTALLHMASRVMRLLGDLIVKVDVAETVVFKVEALSTQLIFFENAYSEKDSALGTQRFETMRRGAMDVLAKIFARNQEQRQSIFTEILSSLEKLPVTRQSARQFKMPEGKPIQLVSALLMRLVQTSGSRSVKSKRSHEAKPKEDPSSDQEQTDESDDESEAPSPVKKSINTNFVVDDDLDPNDAIRDLRQLAMPLQMSAWKDASYVVNYLVQRALTSTKTGDQPYRNLLDIFTEDFISVLGLPDWPAAEMLLRVLCTQMVIIMDDEKRPVPAKNLALDLMGIIGSGLADLQTYISGARKTLDPQSKVTAGLLDLAGDLDDGEDLDINYFRGPNRVVLEYLHSQGLQDPQSQTARGYLLSQWGKGVLESMNKDDGPETAEEFPMQLRNMILDSDWLHNEYDAFESVTNTQARYASTLITLTLPLGKALPKILTTLITAMTGQQPTLRSRSLKSVSDLLTKDDKLLNRNKAFINSIIRCTQDKSAAVRDSALILLSKCFDKKPELEEQTYPLIISLSDDESIMVRKHAMKILKEIYLKNASQEIRSAIAAALMLRVKDLEDSVSEIARQSFEELWIAPFRNSKKDAVQTRLDLENQVSLIAKTTQRGESAVAVLETLLQTVLSPQSKLASANFQVCKDMVAIMFDGLIDNEAPSDRPSQQHLAEALSVFAKSEPRLFVNSQLRLLQPYLTNLSTTDNLPIYNSAVVIFCHVLPSLPSVEHDLLKEVAGTLVTSVSKITKTELPDTVQCLWVIRGVLKDPERIVRVMVSLLMGANAHKDKDLNDESKGAELRKVSRYIEIAGWFGKICNFDEQAADFRARFPSWTGKTVSGLIVDLIYPFTRQKYPRALRETALESIATICQGWPQHYLRADVSTSFELVFHNNDTKLEHIVLNGFLMFFHSEEKRSETGAEIKAGAGKEKGQERLATSFQSSDNDAGATTIAQKFLPHILRIALATTDDLALTATQVIASISRQGLVHPKECGPALVALETSTNKTIASVAYEEHKIVHTKHESMFEKEYMKAVQQAFKYQQDILKDPRGVTLNPVMPKLKPLFEVLKSGTGKVRKRFLANICARIDFDLPTLDLIGDIPNPVLFARFVIENLSFFDYARVDEILHLVACLERMVIRGTGTVVAHAIELEILKVEIVESSQQQEPDPTTQLLREQPLDAARVRHLAVASAILTMVWECRTHLRHLWGLQKAAVAAKSSTANNANGKTTVKDLNKPPTKQPFVSSDKHLDKIAAIIALLQTPEGHLTQCKSFAELLSVDNEVRVSSNNDGGEDDEDAELARQAAGYDTPDEDADGASEKGSTGRGRKRKGGVGVPGTPSGKKRKGNVGATPKKRGRPVGSGKKNLNLGVNGSRSSRSASGDGDGGWD